jgi:hypothetical protein
MSSQSNIWKVGEIESSGVIRITLAILAEHHFSSLYCFYNTLSTIITPGTKVVHLSLLYHVMWQDMTLNMIK